MPYGAGACVKSSCQVSWFAGRIAISSFGTTYTWLLMVMVPPQCGLAWHVGSRVAAWMKPVTSNCVDAGIGSCARPAPATRIVDSADVTASVTLGTIAPVHIEEVRPVPKRIVPLQSWGPLQ